MSESNVPLFLIVLLALLILLFALLAVVFLHVPFTSREFRSYFVVNSSDYARISREKGLPDQNPCAKMEN